MIALACLVVAIRVARRQRLLTTLHMMVYQFSGGRVGVTLLGMPMLLITT